MTTRRQFTWGLVGAGAAIGAPSRGGSDDAPDADSRPMPPSPGSRASYAGATATGELAERIRLTAGRLTRGGRPEYTRDFILADVALDRRRRFWEFSGDLSGRYLEALSILPPPAGPDLGSLARGILAHQREDGRFGDPGLRYVASEIAMPHMALLWGNGRLLVGLLQYHAASKDPQALAARAPPRRLPRRHPRTGRRPGGGEACRGPGRLRHHLLHAARRAARRALGPHR